MHSLFFQQHTLRAFQAALFFLVALSLRAQQVYPVVASGSLTPPHSLVLSDYATTRAEDLTFMLTLNDPVEASRLVRLRLSIMQDGNEILHTNPNYAPAPIVLERQVPVILTGADLAGYLDPANLVHAGGGQPGALLPAGFNSFCLEVIDVQRNVPISGRVCASGFFELAQPPLLDLPLCHSLLPFDQAQNILFSWTPLHLLSLNQPVDVQYEFTLVRVLPGIQDPNDGFNFSTPILQRTVSQNVLYYMQDDPPLEQTGLYAWRVRAVDGRGYDLFQNHGYSQVCSFAFEGGGQLGSPLFSCEGGDCQWQEDLSTTPFGGTLLPDDEIQVGFFTLRLTEVAPGGQGGFSGRGTVYVPYLFSKIQVEFSNIRVNSDRRMYAGELRATAENPELIPPLFGADNASVLGAAGVDFANGFTDATAAALNDYFSQTGGADPPNLVSIFENTAASTAPAVGLPLGLDEEVPGTDARMTVAITGVRFGPRQATLNAVLGARFREDGPWVKFGAKGICFQPAGLAVEAPTLSLLSDVDLSAAGLPVTIAGLDESGQPGTYLSWNCEGFDQFVLKGRHEFDREYLRPKDEPEGAVTATFTVTTRRLDDFMVKVDALGDFIVAGADNFPFHVGDVWLDCSATANPDGLEFPEGYPAENADASFEGFYLSTASVALPPIFQNSASGGVPSLGGESVLFDRHGMTGRIFGKNLVDLSTGDLGGWAYSLDSCWLNIVANDFVNSGLNGKIQLPIMQGDEFLPYSGEFAPAENGSLDFTFAIRPEVVTISLLRARIEFDEDSEITVGRENGEFQSPKANLSGLMTAAVEEGDPGFVGDVMAEIEALQQAIEDAGLGALIPKLHLDGIRFNGLKIDLSADDKFRIESIIPQNAGLEFLGLNADLSQIDFTQLDAAALAAMEIDVEQNVLARGLSFSMDLAPDLLGVLSPTLTFTLVVDEEVNSAGRTVYSFGGFDLSFEAPDVVFDCAASLDPLPDPRDPAGGPVEGQFSQLQVGYFTLTPDFPLTADDGAGTISGTGKIDVDVLGPFRTLNVTFNDVQVDAIGRIIAGEVITGGDAGLFNSPDLGGLLSNVQGQVDAMVNGMNQFSLPVVLGVEADGETERDQGLILMGLVFKPTEAKAQAKVVFDAGGGQYAEFVVEGLTLVPNGIANFDLAVGLAADFDFQPSSSFNPLTFKAYNSADNSGSFIRMDCNGFLEFNLEGSYAFDEDQLVSLDSAGGPVTATFRFNCQKWGEFIGHLESMGRFEIAAAPGFEFTVGNAYLDFSQERNLNEIVFPEDYNTGATAEQPFAWRGFFIQELGLQLPESFSLSGGPAPSFTGENLLIDPQGASGAVTGRDLFDGSIEGWGFSLDSLFLLFLANELAEGNLGGRIEVPLVDDPLPYAGEIVRDENGFLAMNLHPAVTTQLNISALRSYIELADTALITFTTVPDPQPGNPDHRKFKPYADLYGRVGLSVSNDDFHDPELTGDLVQQAVSLVESVLGPLVFTPPAITFEGLKINHPVLPDGRSYGLDGYDIDGGINIGGFELGLNGLNMLESDTMRFNGVVSPAVGLRFRAGIPLIGLDVQFWAKERLVDGKKKYSFGKIVLEANVPTFSCGGTCGDTLADEVAAGGAPAAGSTIRCGGFNIEVTGPGQGKVLIDFLNSTLDVTFDNVSVNGAGQLIGGTILTAANQSMLSPDAIDLGIGDNPVQLPLLDQLGDGLSAFTQLPFSLKQQLQNLIGEDVDLPFDFVVVGLRFTPGGTRMDAVLMFETGDPDQPYIKFGASGLCFTPEGVNLDQIKLYLAETMELGDWGFPIAILKGDPEETGGSYVLFSCSGIEEFHLAARYDFDTDLITPADPGLDHASAYFTIQSSTWGQFMASLDSIDRFSVAGYEEVVFEIGTATIDYSDTENPEMPYEPEENEAWRGFFLESATVYLPPAFTTTSGAPITLSAINFLYDQHGLTGQVAAANLLPMGVADMDGWRYSLDSILLDVYRNAFQSFAFKGQIQIPLMDEDDIIAYEASIARTTPSGGGASALEMQLALLIEQDAFFGIPFLGDLTQLELQAGSTAGIRYAAGKFEPFADLNGGFRIQIPKSSVIPFSVDFPLLGFEHLKLGDLALPKNLTAPKTGGLDRMSLGACTFAGISLEGTSLDNLPTGGSGGGSAPSSPPQPKVVGFGITVNHINLLSLERNGESLKRLNFEVTISFATQSLGVEGAAALGIVGKLDFAKLTTAPWEVLKLKAPELDAITVEADFNRVYIKGGLALINEHPTYGNGFKGLIDLKIKSPRDINVTALAQFCNTDYGSSSRYSCFFVDAMAVFKPGLKAGKVNIHSIGGGVFYNMAMVTPATSPAGDPAASAPPPPLILGDSRLTPGLSLSGAVYNPQQGVLELKLATILSAGTPEACAVEASMGFRINISSFGLESFYIQGDAYIMSKSLADRRNAATKGSLLLNFDFNAGLMTGSLGISSNTPIMTMNNTGHMYCYFDRDDWQILLGTPQNPWSVKFKIPSTGISLANVNTYFMAGHGLQNYPPKPLSQLIGYNGSQQTLPERNFAPLMTGQGFAFGAGVFIPRKDYRFLCFRGHAEGGAGFDVSMMKYSAASCGNGTGSIGINDWYLRGRAYAYAAIGVDVHIDVWFWDGWVEIFDVSALVDFQAELPNPTWLKGRFTGNFRVMGGLAKGTLRFNIEVGERCANLAAGDPLADFEIIESFYPSEEDNPIEVFDDLKASFTVPMDKVLKFDVEDDNGNKKVIEFKPWVSSFVVKKNGLPITGSWVYTDYGRVAVYTPARAYDANSSYTAQLTVSFRNLTKPSDPVKTKTFTYPITTGNRPTRIFEPMLSYHAPGVGQRNFHRGFAKGQLIFKQSGWEDIFEPKVVRAQVPAGNSAERNYFVQQGWTAGATTNGNVEYSKTVSYDWKVRLTDQRTKAVKWIDISDRPGTKEIIRYELALMQFSFFGLNFSIPYMAQVIDRGKEVIFDGINNAGVLEKEAVYMLEIVGVPNAPALPPGSGSNLAADSTEVVIANVDLAEAGYTISTVQYALKEPIHDPGREEKIIYAYPFRVSKYNTLTEKVQALSPHSTVSGPLGQSALAHPNLALPPFSDFMLWFFPAQYHLLRTGQEGFDEYDRIRLRQNMSLAWIDFENYHPYGWYLYERKKGNNTYFWRMIEYAHSDHYAPWNLGINPGSGVLNGKNQFIEFLDAYTAHYMVTEKWAYEVRFNQNEPMRLSEAEIASGQAQAYSCCASCTLDDGVSLSSANCGVALVDRRMRILTAQEALMRRLGVAFEDRASKAKFWEFHWMALRAEGVARAFKDLEFLPWNWQANYMGPEKWPKNKTNYYYAFYSPNHTNWRKPTNAFKINLLYGYQTTWNLIGDKAPIGAWGYPQQHVRIKISQP